MTRALTRTRTTALITVILAVFFFAQAQEARADTTPTPNGVGVGKAVDGTVGGTPRQLSFAGLIRTDIGGTETWTYCIDINNPLQMDQPYAEGDWSQANVANLANIARILEQHPADATASSGKRRRGGSGPGCYLALQRRLRPHCSGRRPRALHGDRRGRGRESRERTDDESRDHPVAASRDCGRLPRGDRTTTATGPVSLR